MVENLPQGRIPLLQKLFFKAFVKTPAGLIAEPFEIFLVVFGLLASISLLLQHFQHLDTLSLPYYHGVVGEFIFAISLAVASAVLIWAQTVMEQRNLLAIRRWEIFGLWLYAVIFGYYAYETLAVGLSLPEAAVYPILSDGAIIVLVLACVIRAVSLSSPITALSVSRINRVKQIKAQLKQTLAEDRKLKSR